MKCFFNKQEKHKIIRKTCCWKVVYSSFSLVSEGKFIYLVAPVIDVFFQLCLAVKETNPLYHFNPELFKLTIGYKNKLLQNRQVWIAILTSFHMRFNYKFFRYLTSYYVFAYLAQAPRHDSISSFIFRDKNGVIRCPLQYIERLL